MVMDFFTLRRKAMTANNEKVTFGEDVLGAMFDQLVHKAELQKGKMTRIGEELEEASVLRLAPGVKLRERFFLPQDMQHNQLSHLKAVENRFGDRFQPTLEIEQLFGLMDGERTYGEIEERFFSDRCVDPALYSEQFRNWIELLADYAIVEWQKL